jgi:hypothetical protein
MFQDTTPFPTAVVFLKECRHAENKRGISDALGRREKIHPRFLALDADLKVVFEHGKASNKPQDGDIGHR